MCKWLGVMLRGSSPKTITTEIGQLTVDVPRDREGKVQPQIIPTHQRRLAGFDEAVISLYGKGMTTGDIAEHLAEVYDTSIARDLVSTVTAKVAEEMRTWQNRPLDAIYPVILIDAIVLKGREGQVANRPVHVAMGVTHEGYGDVLGMRVGPGGRGGREATDHDALETGERGRGRPATRRRGHFPDEQSALKVLSLAI